MRPFYVSTKDSRALFYNHILRKYQFNLYSAMRSILYSDLLLFAYKLDGLFELFYEKN